MKAKKKQAATSTSASSKSQAPVTPPQPLFIDYVWRTKNNKQLLLAGLCIGLIYFIVLRVLFPLPSFYFDSYTYIKAAAEKQFISFRPIEYSEFINFFHSFSKSDAALIFGQYFFNVIANLFLFFTIAFLFPIGKALRITLFVLLTCNPLYLFYSNYILSDSFFCSLTVAWFAILIWILYRPNLAQLFIQLLLLLLLFKLRYNAMIFPVFTTLALVLSKQAVWRKVTFSLLSFAIILLLVKQISDKTEELTGTRVFSAFSGWQMANNALHILKYEKADSTKLENESKEINRIAAYYFDTLHKSKPAPATYSVTGSYLWDNTSPLKTYLPTYAMQISAQSYFQAWTAAGPVYNTFGTDIIKQKPTAYFKYFVWPNTQQYFFPDMEAYNAYNENRDTIDQVAVTYFQYKSNKTSLANKGVQTSMLTVWKPLFPLLNFVFLAATVLYFATGTWKRHSKLFNRSTLLLTLFYFANLGFVAAVAPSVFRYHVFIITLLLAFTPYLLYYTWQRFTGSSKSTA